MSEKTSFRLLVTLLGTLAVTRCSGGNDVAGTHTGGTSDPLTPVAATPRPQPTPPTAPTPRPCPPRFGDECGGPD